MAGSQSSSRGREADTPGDIPKAGWKDITLRVKDSIPRDHVSIVAAGVAFYALLGIIPALAALIGIYSLVSDPSAIQQQIAGMSDPLPEDARSILEAQMSRLAEQNRTSGLVAIGGILVTLWSGSKATRAIMEAMNIVYDEEEKRGFVKKNLTALALTFALIVGGIVVLGLVAALPVILANVGLEAEARAGLNFLRWPILAMMIIIGTAVIYRYAPSRDEPRWRWVSWGSVAAAVLWIGGSALFSLYVSNFGNYNETYGSLGAVVVLLMWFYLSAYVVILGAEINSETERQTRKDTTTSGPDPMEKKKAG